MNEGIQSNMHSRDIEKDSRGDVRSETLLPLGWTRVKRKRRFKPNNEECNDENCQDPGCRPTKVAPLTSVSVAIPEVESQTFSGMAIFCLHERDPVWFQGYFFTEGGEGSLSSSSWRILCEQQDVDDCLQCADGGYRVVRMTLYPPRKNPDIKQHQPEINSIVVHNVEWTGGDMMRLLQERGEIAFEPEQLFTESKAVPITRSIFGSLVRNLAARNAMQESSTILEVVPDIAVVMGQIKLALPLEKLPGAENLNRSV